jgi:hypothetical protein
MERKVLEHLNSKLEEQRKNLVENLADGVAKDYPAYRELCGVIRGLLTAQSEINDLVRKLKDYDNDD